MTHPIFRSCHNAGCVHTGGGNDRCSASSVQELHAECPCCGAIPDLDAECFHFGPASYIIPCERGGTVSEARITLRDPENPDNYILPHEYAVCSSCHARQDELVLQGKKSMLLMGFATSTSAPQVESVPS